MGYFKDKRKRAMTKLLEALAAMELDSTVRGVGHQTVTIICESTEDGDDRDINFNFDDGIFCSMDSGKANQ
jgi:hypothetical protein